MLLGIEVLRAIYIVVFGSAALTCFVSIGRARERLTDADTRRGLIALLATSGLWAAFIAARLSAPIAELKLVFYLLGLVTGLTTVGAWLYFCSAYAGQSYHRTPRYRWLALGVYAAIVGVKLTNPLHGLYFATSLAQVPFPHLVIDLGLLHWVVTGLAYVLSAIGFSLLFDLFRDSSYATTRLGAIVGVAGLPVAFNLFSHVGPEILLPINYESIGVALFALGVLYIADGSFLAVRRFGREQLFDELDEAIVILDTDRIVRDANDAACRLFPALADGRGEHVSRVVPEIESYLPVENAHFVDPGSTDEEEYYLLSKSGLTAGQTTIGHALTFTDVTEVERQRRTVERQHAQFDDFADAITHELRNTINIVHGNLQAVEADLNGTTDQGVNERIDTAVTTTDRMARVVEDLSTMAQYARTVEQTEPVDVGTLAEQVWDERGDGHRLTIDRSGTIDADPTRLELLFERLFEFSTANGASEIGIDVADGTIVVTDDGTPLADDQVARALAYGEAVPDADSGMSLPTVRTVAESHGWRVTVDTAYTDGVRLRIET